MAFGSDFWKQIFSDGTTTLNNLNQEYKWNFSTLRSAFQEEGGVLHNANNVYLFSSVEVQLVSFEGQQKPTYLPVVVAVVSPFPPSTKVAINTIERNHILDMDQFTMVWDPYLPHELPPRIFILHCVDRRTALQNLKLINPVFNIYDCLPYFANPCKEDNSEKITYVEILYPVKQFTIIDEFDWERDDLEKFTNDLITAEELPEDHKDPFMEYVRGKIEDGKRSTYEARVKRETVKGKLSQEEVDAFENMRFYKFYPVATLETPCVDERIKSLFINSHYGKAHQLL